MLQLVPFPAEFILRLRLRGELPSSKEHTFKMLPILPGSAPFTSFSVIALLLPLVGGLRELPSEAVGRIIMQAQGSSQAAFVDDLTFSQSHVQFPPKLGIHNPTADAKGKSQIVSQIVRIHGILSAPSGRHAGVSRQRHCTFTDRLCTDIVLS